MSTKGDKKKTDRNVNTLQGDETNRWNRMFRLLFPDVEDDAMPNALADEEGPYFATAIAVTDDTGMGQWEDEAIPEEDADME